MESCVICGKEVINLEQHYLENMTGKHREHYTGHEFLSHGNLFWTASSEVNPKHAVKWFRDDVTGELAIYTRGEYSQYLIKCIEQIHNFKNPFAMNGTPPKVKKNE